MPHVVEPAITTAQVDDARRFARRTRAATIAAALTASVLTEVALARPGFAEGDPVMRSVEARWIGKPLVLGAGLYAVDRWVRNPNARTRVGGRALAWILLGLAGVDAGSNLVTLTL